ncbi:MAG: alpha/beta hydrolase [Roseovarius sp.]|nr:alpha/beta hydrolase [Roseovarius sp.]
MPRFRTTDGLGLHYEDSGTGRPVICLAGLTRNSADFEFMRPQFPGNRLIRLDYRGRGQSDHDPDFANYNIVREGQDVIELMDHLGLDRAVIIGTSRGGLVAMALSLSHGDRLSGVVLNDIGPEVTQEGLARIMDYVGKEPDLPDLDAAAAALKHVHAADFPGVTLDRWRAQAAHMFHQKPGGGLGLRYDAALHKALSGQAATGDAPDLWTLFDHLRSIPLATIRGANSDLFSKQTLEKMKKRHPGMIVAEVPKRGHVPFLDEPEALDAIRALLEDAA